MEMRSFQDVIDDEPMFSEQPPMPISSWKTYHEDSLDAMRYVSMYGSMGLTKIPDPRTVMIKDITV